MPWKTISFQGKASRSNQSGAPDCYSVGIGETLIMTQDTLELNKSNLLLLDNMNVALNVVPLPPLSSDLGSGRQIAQKNLVSIIHWSPV